LQARQRAYMLLAPCNRQIAVYTPANKFVSAARQRAYMRFALLATSKLQFTPLPISLLVLGFVLFIT